MYDDKKHKSDNEYLESIDDNILSIDVGITPIVNTLYKILVVSVCIFGLIVGIITSWYWGVLAGFCLLVIVENV